MNELWQLLKDVSSIKGWIVKAATAGPIVQILSGWGPPWPPRQFAVAVATAVVQVFVAMWALTFWHGRSQPTLQRAFKISTSVFFVTALIYVILFAFFTKYIPERGKHVSVGISLRDGMQEFIDTTYGGSLEKALDENAADMLYNFVGLSIIRVLLLVSWLAMYLCMSAGMTAFTRIQNANENAPVNDHPEQNRDGLDAEK